MLSFFKKEKHKVRYFCKENRISLLTNIVKAQKRFDTPIIPAAGHKLRQDKIKRGSYGVVAFLENNPNKIVKLELGVFKKNQKEEIGHWKLEREQELEEDTLTNANELSPSTNRKIFFVEDPKLIFQQIPDRKQFNDKVIILSVKIMPNYGKDLTSLYEAKDFKFDSLKIVLHILLEVLKKAKKMHGRRLLHSDIKLPNVMLNTNTLEVALIDVYKKTIGDSLDKYSYNNCGGFLPFKGKVEESQDIFAIGVMASALLGFYLDHSNKTNSCFQKYVEYLRKKRPLVKDFTKVELKHRDSQFKKSHNIKFHKATQAWLQSLGTELEICEQKNSFSDIGCTNKGALLTKAYNLITVMLETPKQPSSLDFYITQFQKLFDQCPDDQQISLNTVYQI